MNFRRFYCNSSKIHQYLGSLNIYSEYIVKELPDFVIVDGFENIANEIINTAKEGDIVITMGGGDIYKAAYIVKEKLS